MSSDFRGALDAAPAEPGTDNRRAARSRPFVDVPVSKDTQLAVEIRQLVEHGDLDQARDLFSGLVDVHQRRASRIAYQYLRDVAEADEAVQDAFVKVFA